MYGVHKQFSKSLHKSNDPQSRRVVKEYLAKQGIIVEDNPNQFGIDLVSADGTLQIEVEHRPIWDGEEFPYSEVNVPERKAKFLAAGKSQYIILSKDFSRIGIIDAKAVMPYIVDTNLVESHNRFVRNGEYFFKIPVECFQMDKSMKAPLTFRHFHEVNVARSHADVKHSNDWNPMEWGCALSRRMWASYATSSRKRRRGDKIKKKELAHEIGPTF